MANFDFDPVEVVIGEALFRSVRFEQEGAPPIMSMLEVTMVYTRLALEEAITHDEPKEKIEKLRMKVSYFETLNDRANSMSRGIKQEKMN